MSRFSKAQAVKQIFEGLAATQKKRPRINKKLVQTIVDQYTGMVAKSLATTGRASVHGLGSFHVHRSSATIRFKAATPFYKQVFPADDDVEVSGSS